jgi:glucosamine--fructose-6-phosphate aminotransferase (isomerizing)
MSAGQHVRSEMREQPAVLARLLAAAPAYRRSIAALFQDRPAGVLLVARGSSDHAATYARYLLELVIGCPVALAAPSLYTRYGATTRYDGWLALGFSQSGETPEIVDVMTQVRARGARTVAVTNVPGAAIADAADALIDLACGPELAVPATKTFAASLASVAVVAAAFGMLPWTRDDELQAVDAVAAALADEAATDEAVELLVLSAGVTHLGRGFTYAVAQEAALKYRETNGRAADGQSVADFLHGPIAAARAGTCVVVYAPAGAVLEDVTATARAAQARGASVVVVGDRVAGVPWIPVAELPEGLAVLPMTVRAQQLAVSAALRRRIDPDLPFGLSKVTATH